MSEPFDRRSGIGASLAPAVCGLSPWANALSAYLYLTGAVPDSEPTEQQMLGNDLEDGIRRAAERRLGVTITKPDTQRHPSIPWMYASPDGLVSDRHGFEAKNVGFRHAQEWGPEGTDEIPDYVIVQAQQQAEVFGLDRVTVAALICGNELRLYEVLRNDLFIHRLTEIEAAFWRMVQDRTPPEPDWAHPATPAAVEALHGLDAGREIALGGEALELVLSYQRLTEGARTIERSKAELRARLIHMMGPAARATLPDGFTLIRRQVSRKAYTVPETTFQAFSVKQPKGATP